MKIYKFTASWCSSCRVMSEILKDIPNNIEEVDIETDEGDDLVLHFRIRSLPTLLVTNNGNEIIRFTGSMSKEQLESIISKYGNNQKEENI